MVSIKSSLLCLSLGLAGVSAQESNEDEVFRFDAQDGDYQFDGLSNWIGSRGHAPIPPNADEFYRQNISDWSKSQPGDVIRKRQISVSGSYSGVGKAYQVMYRTVDPRGPAAGFASLLSPSDNNTNGNLVVFNMPHNAICQDCAPSFQVFKRNGDPEIQSLISEGYAVVIPDYQGSRGAFSVGEVSGKFTLDAIRTAMNIPEFKPSDKPGIGIWGYGMGAHAAGWAGELASEYTPQLNISTVALGDPIVNLTSWIHRMSMVPTTNSIAATSLMGMSQAYPAIGKMLNDEVVPNKRGMLEALLHSCSNLNVIRFFHTNLNNLFYQNFNIYDATPFKHYYELNSLGHRKPTGNYYVYKGFRNMPNQNDQHDEVLGLLKQYCSEGVAVNYHRVPNGDHTSGRNGYLGAIDFFSDVMQGGSSPNSCHRINTNESN